MTIDDDNDATVCAAQTGTAQAGAAQAGTAQAGTAHAGTAQAGGATVRVLLAEDDALMRAGIAVVLGSASRIEVVGEAADGIRAVELCRTLRPDVVLMDVRMPGIDGIEATRRIVAAGLPARVLVLTTFRHDEYVWGALRAGASGFLLKRASPERLVDAVLTVAAGETLLDPSVTRDLVEHFIRQPRTGGYPGPGGSAAADAQRLRLSRLTRRETQVLALVAQGLSNEEIADVLGIAESTAKTHVKRVLAKVGARDRAQAVVIAYRTGLAVPGGPS